MTNTAKAPITHPAGTQVRITRGSYKGREATVYSVVGETHILTDVPGYYKSSSLKAI